MDATSLNGEEITILNVKENAEITIKDASTMEDVYNQIVASINGISKLGLHAISMKTTDTNHFLVLRSSTTGEDAQISLGTMNFSRSKNSFSDVIEGLEFQLETTGNMDFKVSRDDETIKKNLEGFVKAYNKAITAVKSLNSKDGGMQGDSTLRSQLNLMLGLEAAES